MKKSINSKLSGCFPHETLLNFKRAVFWAFLSHASLLDNIMENYIHEHIRISGFWKLSIPVLKEMVTDQYTRRARPVMRPMTERVLFSDS